MASIKNILTSQPNIASFDIDLRNQRVTVEGQTSPSQIARAMKADGRQVIVRGTGTAEGTDQDAAAVCIFESHTPIKAQMEGGKQDVHGIARMVQVGNTTLLDLTIKHDDLATIASTSSSSVLQASTDIVKPVDKHPRIDRKISSLSSSSASLTSTSSSYPSTTSPSSSILQQLPTSYAVYIARSGDISSGASSTGGVHRELGIVKLRERDGYGDLFTEITGLQVWEVIGRAMVIAPLEKDGLEERQHAMKLGPGILAGVIARSAGAWSRSSSNK